MNSAPAALDLALVLLGATGLFEGLSELSTSPLPAVLIILSAMLFLLFPIAGLCGGKVFARTRHERDQHKSQQKAAMSRENRNLD